MPAKKSPQSKLIRNVKEFNKRNPDLAIEITEIKTKKDLNSLNRKFTNAKAQRSLNAKADRLLNLSNAYALGLTSKDRESVKTEKSLQKLRNKFEKAKKLKEKILKFYTETIRPWNAARQFSDDRSKDQQLYSERYLFVPTTQKELNMAIKQFKLMEEGKFAQAIKMFKTDATNIRDASIRAVQRERVEETNQYNEGGAVDVGILRHRDADETAYILTAKREAAKCQLPELAKLFDDIGDSGILLLSKVKFTIDKFATSDSIIDDNSPEQVLDNLYNSAKRLPLNHPVRDAALKFVKERVG